MRPSRILSAFPEKFIPQPRRRTGVSFCATYGAQCGILSRLRLPSHLLWLSLF